MLTSVGLFASLSFVSLELADSSLESQKASLFEAATSTATTTVKTLPARASLAFVGDIMLDRGVRLKINTAGEAYVRGESAKLLERYDSVIGNLEGPITSSPSKTLFADGTTGKALTFTFPTSSPKFLRSLGIDIVSLANNHTQNFGEKGLQETKKLLLQGSTTIPYFGDPENLTEISTTTCINAYCFGLIGFHQFSDFSEERFIKEIQTLGKTTDAVFVLPHWGEEYKKNPTAEQRRLARSWIDAGADAIIGSHSHIIGQVEIYKEKPIFYSLGNYLFDQYFSFETLHGLIVSADFTPRETRWRLTPVSSKQVRISSPGVALSEEILDDLARASKDTVPAKLLPGLAEGELILAGLPRSTTTLSLATSTPLK